MEAQRDVAGAGVDAGADVDIDVVVVGAGPAGLMTANLLAQQGIGVTVLERGAALIDYPRGVGLDDEGLRTFQAAGLVQEVLPHTVPHQSLAFVDAKGRDLARLAPPQADFGWPRRNGFVQPLADRVLYEGLARFEHATVRFSCRVTGFDQDDQGVTVSMQTPDGERSIRARYLVGADGGSSATRKALGVDFVGSTAADSWLVVDVRNDPLGQPGVFVGCDPRRPFVSLSIPHGIRRFEFMLLPGETEADAERDDFLAGLLEPLIPRGTKVDVIRRRVYTHHSRMAARFRVGRVLLIGDAAHLMPVWQGQGYNSGIRDAMNLSWKLAAVLRGHADEGLLDTYEQERRAHAKAMTDLSTWVGRAVSMRNRAAVAARNAFFRSLTAIPKAKAYVVTMRFKPMPTLTTGALTTVGGVSAPPTSGRLFVQPTVATRTAPVVKLDDVLGPWFALIAWNNDPRAILDDDALRALTALDARLVTVRPLTQLHWEEPGRDLDDSVVVVGDVDGSLKKWFDAHPESVLLVRPDRIVGGASRAYAASEMVRAFLKTIGAPA